MNWDRVCSVPGLMQMKFTTGFGLERIADERLTQTFGPYRMTKQIMKRKIII